MAVKMLCYAGEVAVSLDKLITLIRGSAKTLMTTKLTMS